MEVEVPGFRSERPALSKDWILPVAVCRRRCQSCSILSTLKTTGLNQSAQLVMTVPGCLIPGMLAPIVTASISLRISAQAKAQKPSGTTE